MLPEKEFYKKQTRVMLYENARTAKKRKKRKEMLLHGLSAVAALAVVVTIIVLVTKWLTPAEEAPVADSRSEVKQTKVVTRRPDLDVQLLTPNPYSRPQTPTDPITGIVIHYTANPGTTAQNNRNYFEGLKDSGETSVSSNFVIGMEGEIIQCVPTSEIAYASNARNHDTVSIECCHPNEDGKFTEATYHSLVELTAFLMGKFELGIKDVIRHYDVTGKDCPKYFVEDEDAWKNFKKDVVSYIEENGVGPTAVPAQ